MKQNLPDSDSTFNVSQEQLSLALNQVSLGFWEVNLVEGNFMACTDQCKRNFGWDTKETFRYDDMLDCILPQDRGGMQERVMQAIMNNEAYIAQYRVRHPDGSLHWIEARGMVAYENGIPQKISGTTQDITEKKDLEILRDEMLSVAMHELKTPLSAVKGSLQILERHLDGQPEDPITKIVSRALKSTDRITRLLDEMATPILAKGKEIFLDKSPFDLEKLTHEIAQNAVMVHPELRITVHGPQTGILVNADPYRIGQVLTNLINNSVKYTKETPEVDVYLNGSENETSIIVSDQGRGIASEDRRKVFDKFYRAANTGPVEGLGIGLFLCSEIIARHGGSIAIQEKSTPGTDIIFTLPG
ncbi:PAS domain-containing sensor histidine kinase [Taibaiella koreensis]|uniref:PAS domain-containing sensor histidine kinase n=1 Tax=Taibaiella koreensis TaxID=1268548 RepID=UPI000E59AE57|nr:PAS domain-containing sensor histidine kinase [Taibaiella koreensis]